MTKVRASTNEMEKNGNRTKHCFFDETNKSIYHPLAKLIKEKKEK
jgi:hypothetical protein